MWCAHTPSRTPTAKPMPEAASMASPCSVPSPAHAPLTCCQETPPSDVEITAPPSPAAQPCVRLTNVTQRSAPTAGVTLCRVHEAPPSSVRSTVVTLSEEAALPPTTVDVDVDGAPTVQPVFAFTKNTACIAEEGVPHKHG